MTESSVVFFLYISLVLPNDAPVQDDYVIEQNNVVAEEDNGEEVPILSMNGETEVVEEEEPVAEVVNEVPDVSQLVVESEAKIEEMPKKSYASIVSFHGLYYYILLR